MKNERQELLLQIVSEEIIETQEQLLEALEKRGVRSTQATISRDIKQLHLVKEPSGQGSYRYAVSAQKNHLNFADRLRTIFRQSVLSVDYAQNIVVLKTMPGLAQGAASALDGMENAGVVGSLAGDDTVLLVMRNEHGAAALCAEVKEQLR
ncbi:MAG: arginine repressor [Oscillospiraceae bacterium]|nr:arginine repressor [Oscillospiraceae bacterium]MBQ6974633.1 arginine repressor [Oscillospiraceae bacterium]